MRDIRTEYNSIAKEYDDRYSGTRGKYYKNLETDYVLDLIDHHNQYVLDIGAGTGRFFHPIREECSCEKYIGIDISREMLREARKSTSDGTFLQMSGDKLGFYDDSFETVLSIGTFEYFEDLRPFFSEVQRVLVNDGEFIFTVVNRNRLIPRNLIGGTNPDVAHHTLEDLKRQLEEKGFRLCGYHGTFYWNELVWNSYRLAEMLSDRGLDEKLLNTYIKIQEKLDGYALTKRRGGELIIKAKPV